MASSSAVAGYGYMTPATVSNRPPARSLDLVLNLDLNLDLDLDLDLVLDPDQIQDEVQVQFR